MYMRLRRLGRREEREGWSGGTEEEKERGETEDSQQGSAHDHSSSDNTLEHGVNSNSRSSKTPCADSSSSSIAVDGERYFYAQGDEPKIPRLRVAVQYMVEGKFVYTMPVERIRYYCPQLLLSYLLERLVFKGALTGTCRRLRDLQEGGELQDGGELQEGGEEGESPANYSATSPAAGGACAESESERRDNEQENVMALHSPAEGQRPATSDFVVWRKRSNWQNSVAEEKENESRTVKHRRPLVSANDAEREVDHCCDRNREETNNVFCGGEQHSCQIHRRMQQTTVHESDGSLYGSSDTDTCPHVRNRGLTRNARTHTAAVTPTVTAPASEATGRGETATAAPATTAARASGRGGPVALGGLAEAEEVSGPDDTMSSANGGPHATAAAAAAACTHSANEEVNRHWGIHYNHCDVATRAPSTEGAPATFDAFRVTRLLL